MATKNDLLKVYSFKDSDIDLITFALRQLKKYSKFSNLQEEAKELIEYIERLKKENKN